MKLEEIASPPPGAEEDWEQYAAQCTGEEYRAQRLGDPPPPPTSRGTFMAGYIAGQMRLRGSYLRLFESQEKRHKVDFYWSLAVVIVLACVIVFR